MTQVNVDDGLYGEAKVIADANTIEYPTTKNFIDKAVQEKLQRIKDQKTEQ